MRTFSPNMMHYGIWDWYNVGFEQYVYFTEERIVVSTYVHSI